MDNKVSESIWDNGKVIIPMAEVSHIERDQRKNWEGGVNVVFKHSKWNTEGEFYDPTVFLPKEDAQQFISDWCYYRKEVEGL
jgi:hypothetical protein